MISAASATPVWSFHKPGHGRRIFGKTPRQTPAARRRPSTGNGVLPVVSTPMPTTCSGLKPRTFFFASASARRIVSLRAFDVIGRMLPRQIGIARQNHAGLAVLVIPHRRRHFAPVGGIHNQRADGIGAVIQADGVLWSRAWSGNKAARQPVINFVDAQFLQKFAQPWSCHQ